MENALIARLRDALQLDDRSAEALEEIVGAPYPVAAGAEIVRQGQDAGNLHLVLDGWAHRFKWLSHGRRQTTALLFAGDLCDVDALAVRSVNFNVGALTACTVARIPRARLQALLDADPELRAALQWLAAIDNAVAVEWAACLGRRSAQERMAHLFCEMALRLGRQGRDGEWFDLPLTQSDLADATGLSVVHVNRTVQRLRSLGLVEVAHRRLTVPDWAGLAQVASFEPDYLRLAPRGAAGAPARTAVQWERA